MRRRVAAVDEAMDEHALHFVLLRHSQQREQVLDVRVHAAIAQQAHQVQLPLAAALHRVQQQRLLKNSPLAIS